MTSVRRPGRWFAALAIASLLVSIPALFGTWIYDDVAMSRSAKMDGFDDLVASVWRVSSDYLDQGEAAARRGSVTYRPLSMASLIVVQALFAAPLPHHVLSWLLHAATVAALFVLAVRRSPAKEPELLDLLTVSAFALHPAAGEAYLWINGRSDVLAGAVLAWMAVVALGRWATWTPWTLVLLGLLGSGSKETFVVAAAALLVGCMLRPGAPDASQRGTTSKRLALFAVAVTILAATSFARHVVTARLALRPDSSLLPLGTLAHRAPRVLAFAAERALLPLPNPMANLSVELWEPASGVRWTLLFAATLLLGLLVIRKRWDALAWGLGALAVVVPTVFVADVLWYGFDRYLYMPLVLAAIAVVARPATEKPVASPRARRAGIIAGTIGLAFLAWGTVTTAGFYVDRDAFAEAMVLVRPEDPTGYVLQASRAAAAGNLDAARRWLSRTPLPHAPPPILRAMADVYYRVGLPAESVAVVERAHALDPQNMTTRLDLMTVRAAQRRYDEVVALAAPLAQSPASCTATLTLLARWEAQSATPEAVRARLRAIVRGAPCREELEASAREK